MSWQDDAACNGMNRDIFFPELHTTGETPGATAIAICNVCPVRIQCLNHALDTGELHGIWGGTTGNERRRILKQRRAGSDTARRTA